MIKARVKGLLLDLDDTLYAYAPCHAAGMKQALDLLQESLCIQRSTIREAFVRARQEIHRHLAETASSHNRLLYFQRTLERLRTKGLATAIEAYEAYWATFLDQMELRTGAEELLDSLPPDRICLVTDLTAHIQHRKMKRLGLFERIGNLVTSEEVGREKPHPSIFRAALGKLELRALDCLFIGDNFDKDIAGAAGIGIPSCWLNARGETRDLPADCRAATGLPEIAGLVLAEG